jgi:hypothetical protein
MPLDAFKVAFGIEWFIRRKPEHDGPEAWLFDS